MENELKKIHMKVQEAIIEHVCPNTKTTHGIVNIVSGSPAKAKSWFSIKGTEDEAEFKVNNNGTIFIKDEISGTSKCVESVDEVSEYIKNEYLDFISSNKVSWEVNLGI